MFPVLFPNSLFNGIAPTVGYIRLSILVMLNCACLALYNIPKLTITAKCTGLHGPLI